MPVIENKPLLAVKNLCTSFFTRNGEVKATNGVSFHVNEGEVLGIVGESGCGKSVTAMSIMRLIRTPGRIVGGQILFQGQNLLKISTAEINALRGNHMSMIFQQPQSSLNPVYTVGKQIEEVFKIHRNLKDEEASRRTVELMSTVGIADAEQKAQAFPHELSGGQAQRVMIAMALALEPRLLLADEPTTALDVTIQAQILDLIRDLNKKTDTAVVLITHDLGVIAEMADRVVVMYAGHVVEEADVFSLFARPHHPYTQGLIASTPVLGKLKERLAVIEGIVPNPMQLPPGCRFAPRCKTRREYDMRICTEIEPELLAIQNDREHKTRCWLYSDHEEYRAPLKMARRY